jgi:hypothetical protein
MRVLTSTLLIAALWAAWPAAGQAQAVSDEEFIRSLYKKYFNRNPRPQDVRYWVRDVMEERGSSRRNVRITFLASKEFYDQHGGDRTRMMRAYYKHLLNRQPTRDELRTWLDRWQEYHGSDRVALVQDFFENAVDPERD